MNIEQFRLTVAIAFITYMAFAFVVCYAGQKIQKRKAGKGK